MFTTANNTQVAFIKKKKSNLAALPLSDKLKNLQNYLLQDHRFLILGLES